MGLLTDPNAGQGKLLKLLIKHYSRLCYFMYISGLVYFCLLAHSMISINSYFSENALLPGLVESEFTEVYSPRQYYQELNDEMEKYKDAIPYSWFLAKFQQIGLDTYSHNFTLNYPLGKTQKYTGRNVYGILRAPRAASTESVVLSVPYRPPSSVHPTTAPSIAIMLAFAKFANRKKYWAKDIIFLVTEHEQLGVQAWLEAYHSTTCGNKEILVHGDLRGRAGSIQAAINLELHSMNIARMDVKIEGLNGHLPNLDLVTLVNRMCVKEGVRNTFKNRGIFRSTNQYLEWKHALHTMMLMVATQSTGVPNGNHGLFHRFGIEALTLEGFGPSRETEKRNDLVNVGRILEGLFRSLNNLLERFHQSYFFYLLPAADKFVSIGFYIPVIMLLAGTLFVKPCARWYKLIAVDTSRDKDKDTCDDKEEKPEEHITEEQTDMVKVGAIILATHASGVFLMNAPKLLTKIGLLYDYSTDVSVYYGFGMISAMLLFMPFIMPGRNTVKNMNVLNILANLEMGTALIAIGMMNFSLAFICAAIYVPLILLISPTTNRFTSTIQRILWLVAHPFIIMNIVVFVYTYISFPNEEVKEIISRTIIASQQALTFSIIDSLVYGNWLYNVVTVIFLPNWLCLWFVLFPDFDTKNIGSIKKKLD